MFGIIIRTTCVLLVAMSFYHACSAREEDGDPSRRIKQAVFNKVEYHFNQQETDSIYALGSEKFKQSLSLQAFQTVMTRQLYLLGQIQSAELKTFEKNTGIYKL